MVPGEHCADAGVKRSAEEYLLGDFSKDAVPGRGVEAWLGGLKPLASWLPLPVNFCIALCFDTVFALADFALSFGALAG